ncbi:MAG TPA: ATP-binding protein [Candidatus Acidoferrum sp.]|nr:ATP-binding protein [Candidatus Acidoferrum sp.]
MSEKHSQWKRQLWLTVVGVVVAMLAAAVFTLGSLKIPLHPEQDTAFLILFSLSTVLAVALIVLTFVLLRYLVRVWSERRSSQMGSRFKVKMVAGAMGVSLLPVVFMFFFSYAIVNRTLAQWFPRPLEMANEQSQVLLDEMSSRGHARLSQEAQAACEYMRRPDAKPNDALKTAASGADAIWLVSPQGGISGLASLEPSAAGTASALRLVRTLPSGPEIWATPTRTYLAGRAPCRGQFLVAGRLAPNDYLDHYDQIEAQMATYAQQKRDLRAYKRDILLAFVVITLLLLLTTTWVALFLSKQVTIPIQALAEATREISRGNFDHQIDVQAQDELGTLVRSFNRMTEQLGEGRRQINEFTQSLEQAVEEREHRRKMMETVLENIPTGVVSLDSSGNIARVNSAVAAILGEYARTARTLPELLGDEAARTVLHLMRRSLRMGAASREIEVATGGRLVRAAVTVSPLGARRSNPGFIVVIDDLTDLLRAQKAAAWQEVAQRIAHEIKNPLTPIQLSAERLLRYLDRSKTVKPEGPRTEFETMTAECAGLIQREVQTLESLVNEFSQFARFPSARLAPANLNPIVSSALELFRGRLEGITLRTNLASSLPPVKADPELLRHVLTNLIDNAAEAMEGSAIRQLTVATRAESDDDAVVIEISDSGHGISPEDKERLFLPHFSTKGRGTGLGLAIASRIVAEHNGSIRVEDNLPMGSKFVIRFPATEVPITQQAGSPAA